jgi:putative acetyltransferase
MRLDIARAEDLVAFHQLVELLAEYERSLPADLTHTWLPNVDYVQRTYAEPSAAFLARVGIETAGCIAATQLDASTAIMQRLYVKPAYRQHGIARALVTAGTEFCRRRGYARIVLDTERKRLPEAYSLYVALGFKNCEPYGPVTYANPTFMEMRL